MARRRVRGRGRRRARTSYRFTAARRGGGRRRKRSRGKSVPLGMKVGAAVATLPPVVLPIIDALTPWMRTYTSTQDPDTATRIKLSFASWIDSLAVGAGLSKPFNSVPGYNTSGGAINTNTEVSTPKGLFIATTTVGVGIMITSAISSRLARFAGGVRQVRIFNRRVA